MYGVGIPATLNLALPSFMITALMEFLLCIPHRMSLVLGIYYKLQTFIYLSANGIVQGIRPIISYNYGAGEGRVKRIFITALIMIASIMFVGMLICLGFAGKSDRTVYKKFAYDFWMVHRRYALSVWAL